MAYATQTDLEKRYGVSELLIVADRDGSGAVDIDAVADALDDASDEVDTYLAARYELPLATVPSALERVCGDIAMYRLGDTADSLTEERRKRYEDARSWLRDLSKGVVSLGLETPPPTVANTVKVVSNPRVFTRDSMRGL